MKRMTALLLTVIMVMGMIPTTTLAADNAPQDPIWYQGAYLMGSWTAPDGYTHADCNYDVAVYYSPTGEDNTWKSLGYYYITTYSFSPGEMSIDPSYMAMYGSGYYKFAVACTASSACGESGWVWSDALPVDLSSGSRGTIAAPVSGSFDDVTKTLSWTDAEGTDSGFYGHNPIVEMWYTGTDGSLPEADWTMIKREYFGGFQVTSVELSDLLYESDYEDMETGRYVFKVSNLAEDYLWRGGSEAILLDGYYDYVADDSEEEPAVGNAPSNLAWTDAGGVTWDLPSDATGIESMEFELLFAEDSLAPNDQWVAMDSMFYEIKSSGEMLAAIRMELGARMEAMMEEVGDGWYNVRMRYNYADGDSGWTYAWPRLFGNGSSGGTVQPSAGQATNLQWHVVHMADGTTKPMVGNVSFYTENGGKFALKVYHMDEYGFENQVGSNSGYLSDGWFNWDIFTDEPGRCQTGTYYYTIQLLGENGTADGPIMTSPQWNYVRPNTVLQPTDLQWDMEQNQLTWDMDEDLSGWLSVDFYFNANEDNAAEAEWILSRNPDADVMAMDIPAEIFEKGEGWYYFKITQGSNDIAQALTGEAFSSALYYAGAEKTLTVTDPQWTGEGLKVQWTIGSGDAEQTESYSVRYYYCDSANATPDPDNWIHESCVGYGDPAMMPPYLVEDYGDGWYYFTVQAVSSDPLAAGSSAWSALSPALHYVKPTQKLSVSDLKWTDDGCLTWTKDFTDDVLVDYYDVRYYYGATETELQTAISNRNYDWWTSYGPNKTNITIPTGLLRQCGTGYYAYEMQPHSADVTVILNGDWSAMSTFRHVEGASQQLPQPSDLLWHYERYWADEGAIPMTGAISFAVNVPNDVEELEYRIDLYRKEASGDTLVGTMWTYAYSNDNEYATVLPFDRFPELMTSGTYYFTVTAVGDGILYNDSDPVTSGEWTYNRPDAQLTVSNPVWNDNMTMSWTDGEGSTADYYQFRFQHVGEGETFHEKNWHSSMTWYPDEGTAKVDSWLLEEGGTGDYYFQVRAMSNDVEKVIPSEWSAWSTGFEYTLPEITLDAENLRWNADTMAMEFDLPEGADASMTERYQFRVYYGESAEDYDFRIGTFSFTPDGAPFRLPDWVMSEYGGGYYWFQVRVYSSDYTKAFDSNSYSALVGTPLYIKGPDTPAAQATDLQWNVERWNANNSYARTGVLSFKNPCYDDSTRTQFQVDVYRQEASGDVMVGRLSTRSRNEYITLNPFEQFPENMQTGTYYFTVMTVGDNITTCNSEPVGSGTWYYERPTAQKTISAPVWNDDMTMSWIDGTNPGDYYQIRIQYVAPGGKLVEDDWNSSMTWYPEDGTAKVDSWLLEEGGTGDYYFRVRAMSDNVTEVIPSDWSDWSAAYSYTEPTNTLTPKNITWDPDTLKMNWTVDTPEYVDYYEIELCYGAEAGKLSSVNWFWVGTDMLPYTLPQWVFEEFGPGYYGFTVYAYSNAPTKAKSDSEVGTVIYISGEQTQLNAPTDLQWHLERWNEAEGETRMGALSFANPYFDNYQSNAEFIVEVFRKDAAGDVLVGSTNTGTNQPYVTFNVFERANQRMISGDYYFTVFTRGDGIHTINSETIVSETWTYNRPAQELSVSNPVWNDDMTMSWTDGMTGTADYYQFRFQWVPEGEEIDPEDWNGSMTWRSNTGAPTLPEWMLEEYGAGTYYFQVQAHSDDVTVIAPSNWSTWSDGYVYPPVEAEPELSVPYNPVWTDEMTMNWSCDVPAGHYEIQVQRVAAGEAFYPDRGDHSIDWGEASPVELDAWAVKFHGSGTYYFRVRSASGTGEDAVYSDWSEWSAGKELTAPAPTATAEGNTVTLDASMPFVIGSDFKYICGVYSADGQMLGMIIAAPQPSEPIEITLDQAVPAGAYVTIFGVDIGAGWTVPDGLQPIEVMVE